MSTGRARTWLLALPAEKRIGLVSNDATLPVALSRLGRNWDLIGEHVGEAAPDVDVLVITVGAGQDPRAALEAHVDPAAVTYGEDPTDVSGPAVYLPRSAGLEELADSVARAFELLPDDGDTASGSASVATPHTAVGGEAASRTRLRDRLRERLTIGESGFSSWLPADASLGPSTYADDGEAALDQRIDTLAQHLRELVYLVEDHPLLGDRTRVLERILDVAFDQLQLDTAVLWGRSHGAWTATAQRGLPRSVDAPVTAPAEQALLGELARSGAGVLIRSIEQTPEPTAGLPVEGAGSLAGAALTYAGESYGVLTVTRQQPFEARDLRGLRAFTRDAMAGLAIASDIDRLRRSQLQAPT